MALGESTHVKTQPSAAPATSLVWKLHARRGDGMTHVVARSRSRQLDREHGFDRLVTRELPGAYRTASLILGVPAEAEDATQDALLRAWQHWEQLDDADRAGAWFGRILVNVCRDRLRLRRRGPVRWIPDQTVSDVAGMTAERDALRLAFQELPGDQRIAIVLRYYLDLPIEAIASRTGASRGTVKSRLHLALRAMRAAYDAQQRAVDHTDD